MKKVKTALVSVFHKDGLEELLKKLNEEGVKFLSTGGTQQFIESLGYECQKVEEVTTYPSILGGREDPASQGVWRHTGTPRQ